MIKLYIEDYCHNCPNFKVSVSKLGFANGLGGYSTNTDITCKHAGRCEEIKKYLEKENKRND